MLPQICFIQLLYLCSVLAQENVGTTTSQPAVVDGTTAAPTADPGVDTTAAAPAADTGATTADAAATAATAAAAAEAGTNTAAAEAGTNTATAEAGTNTVAADTGTDTAATDTGTGTNTAATDGSTDLTGGADTGTNTEAVEGGSTQGEVTADTGTNTAATAANIGTGAETPTGTDPATQEPTATDILTEGSGPVIEGAQINDPGVVTEGAGPFVATESGATAVQDPAAPSVTNTGQQDPAAPSISSDPAALPSVETGSDPALPSVVTEGGPQVTGSDTAAPVVNKDPPDVHIEEDTYSVVVQKDVTIKCIVKSESDVTDVQWIRNGKVLKDISTASNTDPYSYTIKGAQEENKGYYTCKAFNEHGSSSDLTILEVVPKTAALKTVQRTAHRVVGGVGFGPTRGNGHGPCASKCPVNAASCYTHHNCTHYDYCYARLQSCSCTPMRCSPGTLWDNTRGICSFHYNVKCINDPCRKRNVRAYTDGFNCKLYYRCKETGYSEPMCCQDSMSFDSKMEECVPDDTCGKDVKCMAQPNANDPSNVPKDKQKNVCRLRQVSGDDTQYFDLVAKRFRDCGPGTVYKPEICGCYSLSPTNNVKDVKPRRNNCNPSYYTNFENPTIENEAPFNAWMGQENVTLVITKSTDETNTTNTTAAHYGYFTGTSRIYMPGYTDRNINKILIQIRFFTKATIGAKSQVLLSNCYTQKPDKEGTLSPSIAIVLNIITKKIMFIVRTVEELSPAIMALPFRESEWNNVEFMFDGNAARATVLSMHVKKKGKTEKRDDFVKLKGKIKKSISPLQIGKCKQDDGFFGYIDMFKVYECFPTAV